MTPERLPENNYPGSKDHLDRPGPSQSHASNLGGDRRDQGRPRRERSLSPYSKRLALTQAMNLGN